MMRQFLDDMDAFAQFMESESTLIKEMNSNSNTKKGKKKKKRTSKLLVKNVMEYKTTIGMIDAYLKIKKSKKKKRKASAAGASDDTWKDHNWIKSLLLGLMKR